MRLVRPAIARNTERGFTMIETVMATFILSVGLLAIASGMLYATAGIAAGRGETTAAFLAEQRIEQLKNMALTSWTDPALNAGAVTEAYGTIPNASFYQRVTTITDNPGGTGCASSCKRIQVSVSYKPVTSRGTVGEERKVDVYALVVSRS